jgi:hypothetical protein
VFYYFLKNCEGSFGRQMVTYFLVSLATFIWLFVIKPKSVTLAFDGLVGEADFALCSSGHLHVIM